MPDEQPAGASARPINLWRAVLEAQRAIDPVEKSKTAKVATKKGRDYEYKFASTEDMMLAARNALLNAGVIPQRVRHDVRRGDAGPEVMSVFRLVHPESGEVEVYDPIPMPIASHNAADKALAGALTYSWSYWLRDVLCIPRPDPHEPDRRKDDDSAARYNRGQVQGGQRQPEPPRAGTRKVVSGGNGQGGQGGQRGEPQGPQSDRDLKRGTPQGDARHAMVEAAKALMSEAKAQGVRVDVYQLAGDAALKGKRWDPNDLHTVRQFNSATEALTAKHVEIVGASDVPAFCAACNREGGKHDDGCPEDPNGGEVSP